MRAAPRSREKIVLRSEAILQGLQIEIAAVNPDRLISRLRDNGRVRGYHTIPLGFNHPGFYWPVAILRSEVVHVCDEIDYVLIGEQRTARRVYHGNCNRERFDIGRKIRERMWWREARFPRIVRNTSVLH